MKRRTVLGAGVATLSASILGCGGGGESITAVQKDGNLPLTLNKANTNSNTNFLFQGFNITAWNKLGYSTDFPVQEALSYIQNQGSNFLALDFAVNFNDDGTILPVSSEKSSHPRMEDIKEIVNAANNAGLITCLKPHCTMLNSTTNRNNWNTDISKFLPGNFFKDWNNYLKNLISEVPGAAMLCIGTELNHFDTAFRKEWEDLIFSIRSVYNKPITYDAIFNRWKSTPDVNDVVFWDLMDYIGVSLYVPVTSDDSASVDEIASYWNEDYSKGQQIGNIGSVIDYLKNISSRYNKKIIAIEGGYQSVNTGLINVNSSPSNTKVVNYDLQTRGLDAYLTVLKSSQGKLNQMDNWLAGVSLWQVTPRNMTISGLASIYHTQEFTTYNKRAAAVIKRHYIRS